MMLVFEKSEISARFIDPVGEIRNQRIEVRTNPITGRTSRIAFGRGEENEPGTDALPPPPPTHEDISSCPFCSPRVLSNTPEIIPDLLPKHISGGRLRHNQSILFPNLFPYGSYSAVSLFDNTHFTEIGKATVSSYADCFINCRNYLHHVLRYDPGAVYMAITQNHLPSAGGSLIHPHLQINADSTAPNHHRFLEQRSSDYFQETGSSLFSDYLRHEKEEQSRYIGKIGAWEWMAAFAPEGFFEIWAFMPGKTSIGQLMDFDWYDLSQGVINTQKYYRSIFRNGYNLGMLFMEKSGSPLEIRVTLLVRSNYAPWVRNDHTGFEVMLGDMTTFTSPETIAKNAKAFWK